MPRITHNALPKVAGWLLAATLLLSALDPAEAVTEIAYFDGGSSCQLRLESQVAAGSVARPSKAPALPATPCSADMAHIDGFCIDRYEAHLVYQKSDREVRHPHYERPAAGVLYGARSTAGVFPQAYVSRIEAQRACREAGKRLCRASEWQRACQGADKRDYPYGTTEQAETCNNGKEHLFGKVFGHNPHHWGHEDFNSPELNQEPGFLARAGDKAQCRTPEGVYDMVGNVHEWVSDSVTADYVQALVRDGHARRKQPWKPGNAMFMGGFYATKSEHGPGCRYVTVAHSRRYHDYTTGFRCCRDAR